jgi:hypothetical protein
MGIEVDLAVDAVEHEMGELVELIKDCYALILKINPADRLRFDNQEVYARCVEAIAEWEGKQSEQVQNDFEAQHGFHVLMRD